MTVESLLTWNIVLSCVVVLLLTIVVAQWQGKRRKRRDMQWHVDGVRALTHGMDEINRR